MRLDKFTLRGQEAIQAGIELAERNQNQQVEPEHILCAMLEQPEGIVRPLLGKLGANIQVVKNDCEAAVGRFPKVQVGQFFFSSRRRHTIWTGDWSSDVCSSDLLTPLAWGTHLTNGRLPTGYSTRLPTLQFTYKQYTLRYTHNIYSSSSMSGCSAYSATSSSGIS